MAPGDPGRVLRHGGAPLGVGPWQGDSAALSSHPQKRQTGAERPPTAGPGSAFSASGSRRPEIEFRILGPVEVERDGRLVNLGPPKQRAVLAWLVLHANRVVSRDRL